MMQSDAMTQRHAGSRLRGESGQDPIFILGISERSGTNFLFHLLCLHPDCDPGGPIWENYLTLNLQSWSGTPRRSIGSGIRNGR